MMKPIPQPQTLSMIGNSMARTFIIGIMTWHDETFVAYDAP